MAVRYRSRLRYYREKKGWSQEELARRLEVSRQTVVNIERGVSQPKVLLAIAIGALLGAALTDLFKESK